MRLQPAQPALVEPLRGEEEVQAEGAPEPADRHQQLHELGTLGEQLGELVDDHDECRQRR